MGDVFQQSITDTIIFLSLQSRICTRTYPIRISQQQVVNSVEIAPEKPPNLDRKTILGL